MNIGIIGSGTVGKVLANGFKRHGHSVTIASRDGQSIANWARENDLAFSTFSEIAAHNEVLVLAVKGAYAKEALAMIPVDMLADKTVIDTTNPISSTPPTNGVLHYSSNINYSLMEEYQVNFPKAHFVKAFNSIGSAFMVNPDFGSTKPTMFICGNNGDSKKIVTNLLDQLGFEVEDMGAAEGARAIEPLCMLWCIPGFLSNQWSHAFKLLKK